MGPELQGRVVDALGNPIDGKGAIETTMTDALRKLLPGLSRVSQLINLFKLVESHRCHGANRSWPARADHW